MEASDITNFRPRRIGAAILAFAPLALAAACSGHTPEFESSPPPTSIAPSDRGAIRPGDTVAISFYRGDQRTARAYRLQRGDEFAFSVLNEPDLSFDTIVVLPDGSATFPVIGTVPAAGRTVDELRGQVAQGLETALFRDPDVSIVLRRSETEVAAALRSLSGASEGEGDPFFVTVPPDGRIRLPSLGEFSATGDPQALESEVTARLQSRYAGAIGASVNMSSRALDVVYVMGEVGEPGTIPLNGPMNPLQAVAAAGGLLRSAAPQHTVVARYAPDGQVRKWKVDLAEALRQGGEVEPVRSLASNDLLYVPPSDIAMANTAVDQYVRQMIPLNVGFGVGVSLGTIGQSE